MYILYELPNGTMAIVEATVESLKFMLENDREMANLERKDRAHGHFSIDAMEYEGMEFADPETPEKKLIEKERASQITKRLTALTETQLRRVLMRVDGKTVREIAEEEGTSVNAVQESLLQARKKLEKARELF